jgi:PKD repeat protein
VPPIAAWAWDFGDNTSLVFTQNASHAYETEDTFTVTLTITDTLGYSDSYQSTVQVETSLEYIFLPLVLRNF